MIKQAGIEELYLSPRRPKMGVPKVSGALQDLVSRFGPVQPVVVRRTALQRYEILANPETWLAAQRSGYHQVPILAREFVSDEEADALLGLKTPESPISIAKGYAQRLAARPDGRAHGAITELAQKEGCSRAHVAHLLRLLTLPDLVQEAVHIGLLNLGQAKALLGCPSEDQQMTISTEAIRGRWSVRRTEQAVRKLPDPDPVQRRAEAAKAKQIQRLERRLGEQLGTPVRLNTDAGELIIDYRRNLDVLQGVLDRLGYRPEA